VIRRGTIRERGPPRVLTQRLLINVDGLSLKPYRLCILTVRLSLTTQVQGATAW
jgi:hypothetical protein